MARITLADGNEHDARELEYITIREEWNEYRTADGIVIKTKMAAVRIFRIYDESGEPAFNSEGEPHIIFRSHRHISATEGGA